MAYNSEVNNYLKEVKSLYSTGETREESFYHLLKNLFESINPNLNIIINPSNRGWGFPDIFIMNNKSLPVGYIECKALFTDLDQELETNQLKRYKEGFSNIILTDFLNFTFIFPSDSEKKNHLITQKNFLKNKSYTVNSSNWSILIDEFLSYVESVTNPEVLAEKLARKALFLKAIFEDDIESDESSLLPIYEDFRKELDHTLSKSMFIDEITQLLCYGALITRFLHNQPLPNIRFVSLFMSNLSPLMAQLSYHLMSPTSSFYEDLELVLADILYLLNSTDIASILNYQKMLFHFYETFLKEYNPKLREERGVYITPKSVVKFIVKSIDYLLIQKFGMREGFLNNNIKVLDPAAGTLTFIEEIYQILYDKLASQNTLGLLQPTIQEHALNNFFAFEILLAPYALAHMNLLLKLKDFGVTVNQKVPIFLTNTLTLTEPKFQSFLKNLPIEGKLALKIKTKEDILVILGNPPYRENSVNDTAFWNDTLKEAVYRGVDSRNPKPLRDDYIKFIRWSIWKLNQKNKGIIGFITNHRFLSGSLTRILRKYILDNFQEIYIINLHGAKREDIVPEGIVNDQNIFNITIGVCIFFLVKNPTNNQQNGRVIKYLDLWGPRTSKEDFLISHNLQNIDAFEDLNPTEPLYLFKPVNDALLSEYKNYKRIDEIFINFTTNITTHRDDFVVGTSQEFLHKRIQELLSSKLSDDDLRNMYPDSKGRRNSVLDDSQDFNLSNARINLKRPSLDKHLSGNDTKPLDRAKEQIIHYNYRPFDFRYLYHNLEFIDRPRLKSMLIYKDQEVPTILTGREGQHIKDPIWSVFGYTSIKIDRNYFTRGGAIGFPLFFKYSERDALETNINDTIVTELKSRYKEDISAEIIFNYILGILVSSYYRISFNELLKLEYPRIPFPESIDCFSNISELGSCVRQIFELDDSILSSNKMATYPEGGTNRIENIDFRDNNEIHINDDQWFGNVPEDIFNYYIGGYIILQQWLKGRVNSILTRKEINDFRKIVAGLKELQETIQEINQLLEDEFDWE